VRRLLVSPGCKGACHWHFRLHRMSRVAIVHCGCLLSIKLRARCGGLKDAVGNNVDVAPFFNVLLTISSVLLISDALHATCFQQ
jgi:hypothetical protein